jgi:hypothetical protein
MKPDFVAYSDVRRILPTGEERVLRLGITPPVQVSDHEWTCSVTDPETTTLVPVSGNDGIQTIALALDFLGRRMKELRSSGVAWKIPGYDDDFPIEPYFFRESWIRSLELNPKSEPGAPPNGGPAASVDNSNAPGGPPSVS